MAWVAVGTAAVSVGTGAMAAGAAKKEGKKNRKAQEAQNAIAANAFTPVQVNAAGGAGATFGGAQQGTALAGNTDFSALAALGAGAPTGASSVNPNSTAGLGDGVAAGGSGGVNAQDLGSINLNLGDLDPAAAGLRQLTTQNVGQAGLAQGSNATLDQNFANFQQAGQQFGDPGFSTLNSLLQGSGQAFGNASADLFNQQQNPFQQGLQNSLFAGAGQSFNALPGTQEQSRQQTLDLLRQQAQPFEDRAFSNLQDRQFATGQSGTSGGGLQTEAFARGLGQADLQRQLTAGQEGRNAQTAQLGLAQGQLGAGSGLAGMQDSLLSSALNRFNSITGLSSGLSNQRFTTGQQLTQDQFGRAGSLLQQSFAPQQLQQLLQGGYLQNASAAAGIQSGLQGDAINQANLGLNAAQIQANARLGGVAGSAVSPVDSSTSTALAQLSGAIGGSNAIGGALTALGDRFGSGGQTQVSGSDQAINDAINFKV